MSLEFVYGGNPARIVFGNGARRRVAEWVETLGCRRALVLTTVRLPAASMPPPAR